MEYEIIASDSPVPLSKSPETDTSPEAVLARAEMHAEYLKLVRRAQILDERKQRRERSKQKQKIKNRKHKDIASQSRKRNR